MNPKAIIMKETNNVYYINAKKSAYQNIKNYDYEERTNMFKYINKITCLNMLTVNMFNI